MQILTSSSRYQRGHLFSRVVKQASIDRVVDHLQSVLVYLGQYGLCASLALSLSLVIAFFVQAVQSGTQRGVI
jgi:hypothetical protein